MLRLYAYFSVTLAARGQRISLQRWIRGTKICWSVNRTDRTRVFRVIKVLQDSPHGRFNGADALFAYATLAPMKLRAIGMGVSLSLKLNDRKLGVSHYGPQLES